MRSSLAVAAGFLLAAASLLPACTKTAGIADIYMSLDEDGARKRELFFTDSTAITCVFKVGVGRPNATFSALIRQIRELPYGQGGDDFQPVNRVITSGDFHPGVTNGTPTMLTLKMVPSTIDPTTNEQKQDEDAPFAPGSYRCEVSIDGVPTDATAFNIAYPDCPTAQIATGQKCAGFYAFSPPTTCPKNGASGDSEPTCSCNGAKGWECQ